MLLDRMNKIQIRFLRQRSNPTLETSIHAVRKISENSGIVVVQKWYFVGMSSSWNFPARASPSCEESEPSQAELGHFNFRAETELTILTICQ